MMSRFSYLSFLRYTSILLLFAVSALANAASLWQGPYVGVYLGGGLSNNRVSTDTGMVTEASYFSSSSDIDAVNHAGSFDKDRIIPFAELEAGEDWNWNNLVYGIAFDFSAFPLRSSHMVNASYPVSADEYSIHTSLDTDWLFTLRGRLGYATRWQRWPSLLYLTGGMAITQLKINNHFNDNSSYLGEGESHISSNQIGWTVGGGLEIALSCHVAANLEYSYVDVPSANAKGSISNTQGGFGIPTYSLTSPLSSVGQLHAHLLKIGLKYRF